MIFTRRVLNVIWMEFKMTALNRAFIIITIIGPFLIVAFTVLPSYLASRGTPAEKSIALLGGSTELVNSIERNMKGTNVHVFKTTDDIKQLNADVLNGKIDGYLVIPPDLFKAREIDFITSSGGDWATLKMLQGTIDTLVTKMKLKRAGLSDREIEDVLVTPSVVPKRISKGMKAERENYFASFMTVLAFTMLLYMTILLYGQGIGRSVLSEKTQKTVEILLSSIHSRDLLFGKIFGKAIAGLLQYAVWIVISVFSIKVLNPLLNLNISLGGKSSLFLYLIIYFLLAFFLYSSAYATLGAASSDEQNLGQLSLPLILFLVLPMVGLSGIISNPNGVFSMILSFFPFTSPIVMFQRLAMSNPSAIEIWISILVIILTTIAVTIFAAKIFKVGILLTGKKHSLREIIKWIGYR